LDTVSSHSLMKSNDAKGLELTAVKKSQEDTTFSIC